MQKKAEKIENDFSNRQAYSIAEIAALLGKSRMTIYRYVVSGKIKAIRISSKFTIIPKKSIEEFLEVIKPYEVLPMPKRKPIGTHWKKLRENTMLRDIK